MVSSEIGVREPVQTRSEESTERVLEAALAIAGEGGLGAVTIAAVSQRSGLSNGSIYHRFGDRATMVAAAAERFLGRVRLEVEQIVERARQAPRDEDAVLELLDGHDALFGENLRLFRAFMVEGDDDPRIRRAGFQLNASGSRLMEEWLMQRFGCPAAIATAVGDIVFSRGAVTVMLGRDVDRGRAESDPKAGQALTTIVLASLRAGAA